MASKTILDISTRDEAAPSWRHCRNRVECILRKCHDIVTSCKRSNRLLPRAENVVITATRSADATSFCTRISHYIIAYTYLYMKLGLHMAGERVRKFGKALIYGMDNSSLMSK
jgi:hypothetical protein